MESAVCYACKQPKAVLACGICKNLICKKCAQLIALNSFPFLQPTPEELTHKSYCGPCFCNSVGPALDSYAATVEQAKGVFIFLKSKGGEATRLMSRSEKPIFVKEGDDKEQTLMHLAFLAAKGNFNALLDVELFSKKVRNFGFQTLKWQASGIPTRVDGAKLDRQSTRQKGLND